MSGVGSESLHCQEVPPTIPVHSNLRTTALRRHSGPKSFSIKLFLTTNHSMKFYTMTQDTNKSLMKHIFPNPCDAIPIFSAIFHFTHWSRSTKSGLQGPGFRFWLHIRITWGGGGGQGFYRVSGGGCRHQWLIKLSR